MDFRQGMKALSAGVAMAAMMAASGAVSAQEVTLRMVGAWALGFSPTGEIGQNFMDNVNRLGEGVINIQYVGADDVIPPFDQPEALVNGVFDVWYGAPNYWAGVVPGGDITELSPHLVPDGGPGSDLYEFVVGIYNERGVRHIGHAAGDLGVGTHYLSTNFPVESIDDLRGKRIRVTPLTRHIVQAAGGESITLPPAEIFLAMDRGTVEGFSWPVADAFTRYGWQDVTSYMIDQPMYRSGGSIAMNIDKWNGLSEEAQGIVLQAMAETQEWTREWFAQNLDEQVTLMKEAGMEVLTLSGEEAERWNTLAVDSLWAYYETILTAEQIAEVKELFAQAQ